MFSLCSCGFASSALVSPAIKNIYRSGQVNSPCQWPEGTGLDLELVPGSCNMTADVLNAENDVPYGDQ